MTKDFTGFYFKSGVIAIGANDSFLELLKANLINAYLVSTCNKPQVALEKLLSQENTIFSKQNILCEIENEEDDESYFAINFSKINQLLENNVCFTSVALIDDNLDGLEVISFCRELSKTSIIRVLLIDPSNTDIGITAMNEGLVDQLIIKNSTDFLEVVSSYLKNAQNTFFKKLSQPILHCLSAKNDTVIRLKSHEKILNKLIKEFDIQEYQISSSFGSYVLRSKNGVKYYYHVLLDKHLHEYIEIAEEAPADSILLASMRQKTHAPIFIHERDYKLSVEEWSDILHPIIKDDGFYYSIIQE